MGSLFSKPKTPKLPPIPPVTPLPDPGDEQLKARKRRGAAVTGRNRSGRQSTMLSDRAGDTLG